MEVLVPDVDSVVEGLSVERLGIDVFVRPLPAFVAQIYLEIIPVKAELGHELRCD